MALYRGDLIEALHVAGAAPEFSQWLDAERLRLRRLAQDTALRCVEEHNSAGDAAGAIQWARRAVQLESFDERGSADSSNSWIRPANGPVPCRSMSSSRCDSRRSSRYGRRLKPRPWSRRFEPGFRWPPPRHPRISPRQWLRLSRDARHRSQLCPRLVRSIPAGHYSSSASSGSPSPWYWQRACDAGDPPCSIPIWLRSCRGGSAAPILRWRTFARGMLDLLDGTLTGDRGLHAADPRTTLRAVNAVASSSNQDVPLSTAMAIAQQIGAGRIIQGAVVGTPAHLTIEASEFTAPDTRPTLTVAITGSIDSLPRMVERLTAQLLAHETSDPEQVQSLATTSLPALRVYLEGRAAFRRGRYGEATHDFGQALTLDSTFTLAALGLSTGSYTMADIALIREGRRLAWRDSRRLSPRDRALLIDVVGPNYPGPSDERGYLAARQRAVVLAPESPEAAYWLGDSFFHHGRLLVLPDWQGRAIAGFERAIELDSAYLEPYQHLIEIKLQQGDTIGIRALAATYFAMDSAGEYRDFVRWRVAVGLADSAGLTALRAQFRGMSTESLFRIAAQAQVEGIELSDAELAARSLAAQAGDDGRWTTAAYVSGGPGVKRRTARRCARRDGIHDRGSAPAARGPLVSSRRRHLHRRRQHRRGTRDR